MKLSDYIDALFSNRVLVSALVAWLSAQLIKTILYSFINHEFNPERLVGSGGMPSSHSATVCALVVATSFNYGPASFEFAIAFLFAVIVLHDARGVRLETGKQAEAINTIYQFLVDTITDEDMPEIECMKVLVGHTPLQVVAGSALGIIVGLFLH